MSVRAAIRKVRYAASEIADNYHDAFWWEQRLAARVAGPVVGTLYGNEPVDFMAKDWDNLLILDACRTDAFEQTIDTDQFDEYRRVHSVGCSSPEWMEETFAERSFPDTVYVTGNPWISKIAPDSFHKIVNLWITERGATREQLSNASMLDEAGFDSTDTIHPDTLSDVAREVHQRYPNKRLIVHYFQPHGPYIGKSDGTRREEVPGHALRSLRTGELSHEEVWGAYVDNLLYAFTHANDLAGNLGGRSVFTADHGELFGEWLWPVPVRGFAHPSGLRHPKLTEVPWAVKEVGSRRRITEGEVSHHEADEAEVDERLRDLGYRV